MQTPGFDISPHQTTLARALFAALTFHLNWLEAVRGYLPPNWDVLWSLSVEEMFYLFFPLICVAMLRLRYGQFLFIGLLLIFVSCGPFARTVWTTNPIWREKTYLGGMDGIALGCLSALLMNRWLEKRVQPPRYLLESAGAAMMFLIALWPGWPLMTIIGRSGLDGTILALGTCLVILGTASYGKMGGPFTAGLRWFGRHSYEVYMTHEFVVVGMVALYSYWHHGPVALWVAAILALCAPLGLVIARYFSEPLNRRLRGPRFSPNTATTRQDRLMLSP
jgi:peptidoglycan/LPS O-acetylase OafA/YrhL